MFIYLYFFFDVYVSDLFGCTLIAIPMQQQSIVVTIPKERTGTSIEEQFRTTTPTVQTEVDERYNSYRYHPEYYSRISRIVLEGITTSIYLFSVIAVEIYHQRYPIEFPLFLLPLFKAATQIFILYMFFAYGVGYLNPFTVIGALLVDVFHGPKRSPSLERSTTLAAERGLVMPHSIDPEMMGSFILAQVIGTFVAGLFIWLIFMNVPSTQFGFAEFDTLSFSTYVQNIAIIVICSIIVMFPKLAAGVKRATIGKHIAVISAAGYVMAYYLATFACGGYLEIYSWLISAILSNVGGYGWLNIAALEFESLYIIIGNSFGMLIAVGFVFALPKRYLGRRRKIE